MEENGIDRRLESKLGFDKVRAMVSDRCSTEYAVGKVADKGCGFLTTFHAEGLKSTLI